MGEARDDLLKRIVDDVARHGLGDRSLRELAAAVGSSHRMLLYHFDSRDGLVGAIVAEVEATQRALLSISGTVDDPLDVARQAWQRVSDPKMRPFVQLFFEAVAYSSRSSDGATPRKGEASRSDQFTQSWIDEASALSRRMGRTIDPIEIRLGVAVVRGLLVDIVGGGDIDGATASLEAFLSMWSQRRP